MGGAGGPERAAAAAAVAASASAPVCAVARDKLAHDVYQTVLRTGRCDWIELMHCAPLASQYHESAYSMLKYGLSGAPYAYLPLTLQQPSVTDSILHRQRQNEENAWRFKLHLHAGVPLADTTTAIHMVERMSEGVDGRAEALVDKQHGDPEGFIKTSSSHPISVSPIVPVHLLPRISAHVYAHLPGTWRAAADDDDADAAHISLTQTVPRARLDAHIAALMRESESYVLGQVRGEHLIRLSAPIALDGMLAESGAPLSEFCARSATTPQGGAVLGNLLLSSCPGKKVRLDERAQGKSPICRDLRLDFDRIKQMGVRAIVCCLDDEELSVLGAPCERYQEEAQSLGFDLICMPIAEGFAPLDMVRIDMIMSMLILNYTLRGTSILVHCRGGVGRAGLVACVWLLKMGLVGTDALPLLPTLDVSAHARDTVLRVIEVVRKRRSLRAVETAEQARFLLEYVRYMYAQEHARLCLRRCAAGAYDTRPR